MNTGSFNISSQQVQACKCAEAAYGEDQVPPSLMCTCWKAPERTQARRCVSKLQKAIGQVDAHKQLEKILMLLFSQVPCLLVVAGRDIPLRHRNADLAEVTNRGKFPPCIFQLARDRQSFSVCNQSFSKPAKVGQRHSLDVKRLAQKCVFPDPASETCGMRSGLKCIGGLCGGIQTL